MNELRLDPLTGRWIIVSDERAERPQAFLPRQQGDDDETSCPFCPEHSDTEPAVYEESDDRGWTVRVVRNRYPALTGEEPMSVQNLGPIFTQAVGSGLHEVLILTPEHKVAWPDMDDQQLERVMRAMCQRLETHTSDSVFRYTQIIINSGREAGASIEHPHAQLLAMPFVPRELVDEQAGFARFQGNCLLCATMEAEASIGPRVVSMTDQVATICPFWSRMPYEMLIIPRSHEPHMHEADNDDVQAVGNALRDALRRLRMLLGDVAYNVVFHAAPYRGTSSFHWHVHVLPKLVTRAGFELGTGVSINIVPPEAATADLRASR